jgi:hypothetical protein
MQLSIKYFCGWTPLFHLHFLHETDMTETLIQNTCDTPVGGDNQTVDTSAPRIVAKLSERMQTAVDELRHARDYYFVEHPNCMDVSERNRCVHSMAAVALQDVPLASSGLDAQCSSPDVHTLQTRRRHLPITCSLGLC